MPPTTKIVHDIPVFETIDWSGSTQYGDFRDDLVRDGFAIVREAIPRQKALQYAERVHEYLESFGLGYQRNDPSTIHESTLPVISEKGMLMHYGVSHEDFVWEIRSEAGVIAAFETVFQTEDLIVSFDAINVSFPNRKDIPPNKPWAHQDQDPDRPGFRCLQGLVNLLPCGDDDGGLIILKGAHRVSEEFHHAFRDEARIWQWTNEWYGFTEAGLEWFRAKGYEFVKVNCGPGDLLIWDSRAPHYNLAPRGHSPRFAVYTCYAPVWSATKDDLELKRHAYETHVGTSHWPQTLQLSNRPCLRFDGTACPYERTNPRQEIQLSERAYKLTGIPYLKTQS